MLSGDLYAQIRIMVLGRAFGGIVYTPYIGQHGTGIWRLDLV